MTNYKITEAHSGNSEKEIQKAKRHFRKMKKKGIIYGEITDTINIQFRDVNYSVCADFVNEFGQEVCPSVEV